MTQSSWRKQGAAIATTGLLLAGLSACSSAGSDSSSLETAKNSTVELSAQPNEAAINLLPQSLRDRGYIVNGVNAAQPPFEFFDSADTLTGLDIDLANLIGAALDLEVRTENAGFASLLPGIQGGRYDLAISGFGDTLERQQIVDFVDYVELGTSLMVKAGNPTSLSMSDLCGKKVAVVVASTQIQVVVPELDEACSADGKAPLNIIELPESSDPVVALASGRADASLINTAQGAYMSSQQPDQLELTDDEQVHKTYVGLALPKGSPLTQAIAEALNDLLANGTYQELLTKWGLDMMSVDQIVINGTKD
ncbi:MULTISPECIES: ABC transporter substrate-binding protein [unclassified Rhodococcus (in: high G+C Gram-positive bacteria)]|uniref:ABC transporter substrate-binding protein n=1 Tax=unclassified Rhodococcus (in: high G+C Gram-positive bacteria) TaxID=192944 RepID=UPI00139231FF|nr:MULTISPECIES: ABC transporter substrate-binding protein [unclassified Rhodococcus (in: high G+C Gram-positive bacteria)]